MKMHKFTLYILDTEDYGKEEYEAILHNLRHVTGLVHYDDTSDIGEWSDDHPLNKTSKKSEHDEYFSKEST